MDEAIVCPQCGCSDQSDKKQGMQKYHVMSILSGVALVWMIVTAITSLMIGAADQVKTSNMDVLAVSTILSLVDIIALSTLCVFSFVRKKRNKAINAVFLVYILWKLYNAVFVAMKIIGLGYSMGDVFAMQRVSWLNLIVLIAAFVSSEIAARKING